VDGIAPTTVANTPDESPAPRGFRLTTAYSTATANRTDTNTHTPLLTEVGLTPGETAPRSEKVSDTLSQRGAKTERREGCLTPGREDGATGRVSDTRARRRSEGKGV